MSFVRLVNKLIPFLKGEIPKEESIDIYLLLEFYKNDLTSDEIGVIYVMLDILNPQYFILKEKDSDTGEDMYINSRIDSIDRVKEFNGIAVDVIRLNL